MPNLLCHCPTSELETFGDIGSQRRWLLCSTAPKRQPQEGDCKVQILGIAGIRMHGALHAPAKASFFAAHPSLLLNLQPQDGLDQQQAAKPWCWGLAASLPSPDLPRTTQ